MGWTVLYIAFGVVALWLLAEVLLQYKARLRWRLLAFCGFLCVVLGAVMPSVPVIGLGIATFATGQTFVTLSYRRGFSTGWALGGSPGSSRRRRGGAPREAEPSLEVSDLQTYEPGPPPEPVDDYGYAGYHHDDQPTPAATADMPANSPYGGGDYGTGNGLYGDQPDETQVYASPFAEHQQPHHQPYADTNPAAGTQAYAYADDQHQQYAPYSDPYGGYGYDTTGTGYDPQGTQAGPQQPAYDYGGYGGDYGYPQPPSQDQPHQTPYYPDVPETPPGGVWVPQQRDAAPPPLPPEQPPVPPSQPYPYGYEDPQYPHGYYGSDQRTGY